MRRSAHFAAFFVLFALIRGLLLDAPEVIAGLRHWPSAESRGVARECHTSANISIVIPRVDEL